MYIMCDSFIHNIINMYSIKDILISDYGFSPKEVDIFLYLYQYGEKPASTVAKAIWDERTNVYKTLRKMEKKWYISSVYKDNTTLFFVSNKDIFSSKITFYEKELQKKKERLSFLEKWLEELLSKKKLDRPEIVFFEWVDGINNIYHDILSNCKINNFRLIKVFVTNLTDMNDSNKFVSYYQSFLWDIKQENINLDVLVLSGNLVLENIYAGDIVLLENLPIKNPSVQIYILWEYLYMIMYKDMPYAIKVRSDEFVSVFHFLFNFIYKTIKN